MERSNYFAHWPNEYQEEIVQALARNDQGAENPLLLCRQYFAQVVLMSYVKSILLQMD